MHTSIGRLLRAMDPKRYVVTNMTDGTEAEPTRNGTFLMVSDVAHYVIDDKIVGMIDDKQARDTVIAMGKAGIRHLPFDPILLEFRDSVRPHILNFVRLQSKPMVPFTGKWKAFDTEFVPDICGYICQMQNHPEVPGEILMASMDIEVPIAILWGAEGGPIGPTNDDEQRPFTVLMDPNVADARPSDRRRSMEYAMYLVVAEAMAIAMLMLNTKGVSVQRVDTTAINKARAKRNVPPSQRIHPYSVVRIGHVYDRHGKAHDVAGSGRHMPVHWRAGHLRNQFYGAGRKLRKLIFIEPCLVNFDPLSEAPLPQREVLY